MNEMTAEELLEYYNGILEVINKPFTRKVKLFTKQQFINNLEEGLQFYETGNHDALIGKEFDFNDDIFLSGTAYKNEKYLHFADELDDEKIIVVFTGRKSTGSFLILNGTLPFMSDSYFKNFKHKALCIPVLREFLFDYNYHTYGVKSF
ncbi:hypothetical protein L1O48_05735 [Ligilactobacillus equi]|uniref:hypothetical protein n=1 Tax=Ligilactobacillus equi TaxID=137357 RepID=UPI002ED23DEB